MPGILHVDMDAFYAAVEVHDDPSLAGRPLIVGGAGRRGVVAACSYEARVFGVRSAMPSARARSLCPAAVFVAGRFERYREVSAAIHAVFQEVTPVVEGIALDEAFLDVRGAGRLLGPPALIAADLRARIAEVTGLTCSVGASAVKFVAKLASEAAKPVATPGGTRPGRGVVVVEPGQEIAFLHPLPVEALWGVGPATSARLRALGLDTVGALAGVEVAVLERAVGRAHGTHLHRLANAIDGRGVVAERTAKSVGHEETYAVDRRDQQSCRLEVVRMADAVAARLRASGRSARTVTLKVRFGDFTTITRSRTLPAPVDTARQIAGVAASLLEGVDVGPGVRLLGVSASQLAGATAPPGEQLALAIGGSEPAAVLGTPGARGGPGRAGMAGRDRFAGGDQPAGDQPAGGRTERRSGGGGPGGDGSGSRVGSGDPRRSGGGGVSAGGGGGGSGGGGSGGGGGPGHPDGWGAAADAVDQVRGRFGARSVGPASLLGADGLRIKRQGDTRWGPAETSDDADPLP